MEDIVLKPWEEKTITLPSDMYFDLTIGVDAHMRRVGQNDWVIKNMSRDKLLTVGFVPKK